MKKRRWCAGFAVSIAAVVVVGCATGPTSRDKLLKRAAFDLHCTKDELSVSKIDDRTRGVRGCGRQATYVQSCDGHYGAASFNCTWVMNGNGSDSDD
ncbi:MAG TPA: hypothetical protein VIF57_02610 [Polyangia bacterium]